MNMDENNKGKKNATCSLLTVYCQLSSCHARGVTQDITIENDNLGIHNLSWIAHSLNICDFYISNAINITTVVIITDIMIIIISLKN